MCPAKLWGSLFKETATARGEGPARFPCLSREKSHSEWHVALQATSVISTDSVIGQN